MESKKPSPSAPAADHPNEVMKGHDGAAYISRANKDGKFAWRIHKGAASKVRSLKLIEGKDKALAAVRKNWKETEKYKALRNDPDVMLEAMKRSKGAHVVSSLFGTALRSDRKFIFAVAPFAGADVLAWASKPLRDDRDLVLLLAHQHRGLKYASKRLRDDSAVVLAAMRGDPDSLQWASKRLRNDSAFVLKLVKTNEQAMRFAGSQLVKDAHFIAAAAKANPASFALVGDKHRDDKKIVLAAVAADARTLRYASSRLKKDKDVRAAGGK